MMSEAETSETSARASHRDAAADRVRRAGRDVAVGVAALILADLVGGVLAISARVNTAGEAWNSAALLAAPWPMMLAQILLVVGLWRWTDWRGVAAATLLAAACAVSVTSAFFDGALANDQIGPGLRAYQLLLLG